MNKLRNVSLLALALCALSAANAGQSYLVTDRFVGSIHRLEDINGDGDALDAGERLLWGQGLSNAAELCQYQAGFLVLDSIAASASYYEDRNRDGDALDAGESVLWTDGLGNPYGIDVAPDGNAYLSDYGTHQVFRARDRNADGDALDAGERVLYANSVQGAVSVLAGDTEQFVVAYNTGQVHVLRDENSDGDALDADENVSHTPNSILQVEGIAPRLGGGYFVGSWFDDLIYRVVDKNNDGDAFDVGEVLSYADNFIDVLINNPWGLAPGVADELFIANSAAANVLALRDKNHDGDALDLGEVVVYADGIAAPVDIVAMPTSLPGDFNNDGAVDAADYVVWRKTDGTPAGYSEWRANFGWMAVGRSASVPEPAAWVILSISASASVRVRRNAPTRRLPC